MHVTALVVIDAHEASLTRYQLGGESPVITHRAHSPEGGPVTFTADVVETFRTKPHPDFYVGAGAPPPSNPFGGGTPVAMRRPVAAA